jgi:hypothetical protein
VTPTPAPDVPGPAEVCAHCPHLTASHGSVGCTGTDGSLDCYCPYDSDGEPGERCQRVGCSNAATHVRSYGGYPDWQCPEHLEGNAVGLAFVTDWRAR